MFGVRTGSIANLERSRRGVECEIAGAIMEWRIVGMKRDVGQIYEDRDRTWEVRERFGVVVGVRISLCKS